MEIVTEGEREFNKAVVRRYVAAILNDERYDDLDSFLAHDFVDHFGPTPIRGARELEHQMIQLHDAFQGLDYQIVDLIAEGNKVVVHLSVPGRHTGPYAGIPATGRPVLWRGVMIYSLADGKITTAWGYWNVAEIMAALQA